MKWIHCRTDTMNTPREACIIYKLQFLALCLFAGLLLFYSSKSDWNQSLYHHPVRSRLVSISSTTKYRTGSRLFRDTFALQRQKSMTDEELSYTDSTSQGQTSTSASSEDADYDGDASSRVMSLLPKNSSLDDEEDDNSALGVQRSKWIIRWKDSNFTNLDRLPLREGSIHQDSFSDKVIFNRVGKCGSRSVLTLLGQLAKDHKFYLISSQTFNQKHIGREGEENLVSILRRVEGPYIYQRHLHYIDFPRYGVPPPTYINIIREPMERAISQYYFSRFGDEKKQDRKFDSKDPNKYMSYEECVRQRLVECTGKRAFYIIPFFCGQDERCTYPTRWAYRQAVQNVKNHYLAVGVIEELEDTLLLFEKVMPKYFGGALDTFLAAEQRDNKSSVGVTKFKQKPSEKTALYVKTVLMKYEYLFYNWIRDRMHKQMEALGLKPYHSDYR